MIRWVGVNIMSDLKVKAEKLLESGRWHHVYYVLFSKMGFTTAMRNVAREGGIRLIESQEMVQRGI